MLGVSITKYAAQPFSLVTLRVLLHEGRIVGCLCGSGDAGKGWQVEVLG